MRYNNQNRRLIDCDKQVRGILRFEAPAQFAARIWYVSSDKSIHSSKNISHKNLVVVHDTYTGQSGRGTLLASPSLYRMENKSPSANNYPPLYQNTLSGRILVSIKIALLTYIPLSTPTCPSLSPAPPRMPRARFVPLFHLSPKTISIFVLYSVINPISGCQDLPYCKS